MGDYRGICISGDAGSGKTTAARGLLERLPGWQRVSTGGRFRNYCAERGLDPQQIFALPDELHRQFDREMSAYLRDSERFVSEGRLVCYLARELDDVLRVWCECPLAVRAERVAGREAQPPEVAQAQLAERDRGDLRKFRRLYGVDYHDPAFYDLVVDTVALDQEGVVQAILTALGA